MERGATDGQGVVFAAVFMLQASVESVVVGPTLPKNSVPPMVLGSKV